MVDSDAREAARSGPELARPDPGREESIARTSWLIGLRWIAVAGVLVASGIASRFDLLGDVRPLVLVAIFMAAYNIAMILSRRLPILSKLRGQYTQQLFTQIVCDIGALTLLLHWSGGAENPFFAFYAFHMVIGAICLPRKPVHVLAALCIILYGGTVLAEFAGVLPHYDLRFSGETFSSGQQRWQSVSWISGLLSAFTLLILCTVYFVQSLEDRRREAIALARQREQVAHSRERLARIGDITAGVAHTVRNPVHGALNCIDLLREKTPIEGASPESILHMLETSLWSIERVTRRLLTLTREEPLAPVPTDLGLLMDDTCQFVHANSIKHGVSILRGQAPSKTVELDPDRLSEVLICLLDNAIAASNDGGEVLISSRMNSTEAVIEVTDRGTGITPENLARVMDPFFTTKAAGEGSGLGLAITRRVVEEHGGEVEIESRVGQGTRVRVHLPITQPRR